MIKRLALALAISAGAIGAAYGQASVFQQNQVFAGPTSGSGHGAPRLLVGGDLPNPGASSKGGVQSGACSSHNWFNALSTGGVLGCAQPNFSDLAGSIAAGQIPSSTIANSMLVSGSGNTVKGTVNGTSEADLSLPSCSTPTSALQWTTNTGFGCATTIGAAPVTPQGRLTLTSGTAVPTSSVTAATTLYYTPATGRFVPIWNGSILVNTDTGGEISQATTDTTKSPAAVAANQVYDIFVWNDGGTIRATRGPPWSAGTGGSNAVRGTGVGSTALTLLNGVLVNANAITNGPAANYGTYVGTVMSDASSQLDMVFGGSSAGGTAAVLGVWNAYNRVLVNARVSDSTSSWTYNSATPRAVDASNNNRVTFVTGGAVDAIQASYMDGITLPATASAFALIGFAMDSTSTFDRNTGGATPTANINFMWPSAVGFYSPKLGQHYIQAIEQSSGTNTTTFSGNGSSNTNQQLEVYLPM